MLWALLIREGYVRIDYQFFISSWGFRFRSRVINQQSCSIKHDLTSTGPFIKLAYFYLQNQLVIQMRGFHPENHTGYPGQNQPHMNPLDPYDDNMAKSGHIKKMKSNDQLPQYYGPQQVQRVERKMPFIEPGTPCGPFQEVLSTTTTSQSGVTTFLMAKALTGPTLQYASQACRAKQPAKKPTKQMPELPKGISGELGPHLYNYSTITHEGLYRKTNEDKLTIYLEDDYKWFSIYDGHGGTACSQFMKEHLHEYFFALDWRKDVPNALRKAFITAEQEWRKKGDNSGTCALAIFIYENICYVANLGDSRAVLVSEGGSKCYQITKDHKPSNADQQKRVIEAGGKIYQTTAITEVNGQYDMIVGPLRVFPGRLSTTRTFGDFEAKDNSKDGNDKVVICEPEINSFEIDTHDFIIMGSDGLWDRMDNIELVEIMQQLKEQGIQGEQWFAKSSQVLLEESMKRGSTDNISIVIIGLTDPEADRAPKKGNEHIKIMGSLNGNALKKKELKNKQNSYPDKLKDIDSRIQQINRTASKLAQSRR